MKKILSTITSSFGWLMPRIGCLLLGHHYVFSVETGDRVGKGCAYCEKFQESRESRRRRRTR